MRKKTGILVVDDSAFMRKAITMMLEEEPTFDILETANNGEQAIEYAKRYKPDLITLDIEMPGMSGLEVLEVIMRENPTPVIVISSLTQEGAETTMKALEIGAVDFIPKSLSYVSLDIVKIKDLLIDKIKGIVKSKHSILKRVSSKSGPLNVIRMKSGYAKQSMKVVAMGVSTGGPPALKQVIPRLPGDFPRPVLIVQHMPPRFTKSLSERLNGMSEVTVKEAEEGDALVSGQVLIAPGGKHMTIRRNGATIKAHISDRPDNVIHRPSVDVMIKSVVEIYGSGTLGIIMTGMGKDGLEGIRAIKEHKGRVIAQSEDTCVVYGMPKAVVQAGFADKVTSLDRIANEIVNLVNT